MLSQMVEPAGLFRLIDLAEAEAISATKMIEKRISKSRVDALSGPESLVIFWA
jgi:hypothetical protein